MPASQAGRRGFDPRLPLHVFNGLEAFESLSITAITALSSPITSRSRLEGVTSTFQPNFRTSHAASISEKLDSSASCAATESRLFPIDERPPASARNSLPRIRSHLHLLCCPFALSACEHQRRPASTGSQTSVSSPGTLPN